MSVISKLVMSVAFVTQCGCVTEAPSPRPSVADLVDDLGRDASVHVEVRQGAAVTSREVATEASSIEPKVAELLESWRYDAGVPPAVRQAWTVPSRGVAQRPVTSDGLLPQPAVATTATFARNGTATADRDTSCDAGQVDCDRPLDELQQISEVRTPTPPAEHVMFEVGVALNNHHKLRMCMGAEQGQLAEIRMDDLFKIAIVATRDDVGIVMFEAAGYEFDGRDYRLLADPTVERPADGSTLFQFMSGSGRDFDFYVKPLVAAPCGGSGRDDHPSGPRARRALLQDSGRCRCESF